VRKMTAKSLVRERHAMKRRECRRSFISVKPSNSWTHTNAHSLNTYVVRSDRPVLHALLPTNNT